MSFTAGAQIPREPPGSSTEQVSLSWDPLALAGMPWSEPSDTRELGTEESLGDTAGQPCFHLDPTLGNPSVLTDSAGKPPAPSLHSEERQSLKMLPTHLGIEGKHLSWHRQQDLSLWGNLRAGK